MYTHGSELDYPSISQINMKVKQHAINIIFAVTQQQHSVYKELSEHIEGSSSAVLSDDPSNIVELVRDEYKVSSTLIHSTLSLKLSHFHRKFRCLSR
jgi:integrin beta 1